MLNCRRFVVQLCKKNKIIRSFHNSRRVCAAANQATRSPPPPLEAEEDPILIDQNHKSSFAFKFLKYGFVPAFLATSATLAYATYTYTADEVEEMKKPLAHSADNYQLLLQHKDKDASSLQKLEASLYSAAVSASIKCIETYVDLRRSIEEQVQGFAEPSSDKLLPDLPPEEQKVLTLVLDLNETLIYTDWKRERGWRTFKRPGAEIFLERLGQYYEIVVYSDQLDMYVNPIVDRLDTKNFVRHRLFRPATRYQDGKHYRDLSKLNRDPSKVIYLSGHALETCLQPENCAPIKPWKLEDGDKELLDMIPFLEFVAIQNYSRYNPPDLRQVLSSYKGYDIATEFHNRQREANEKRNVLLKRIWPSQ